MTGKERSLWKILPFFHFFFIRFYIPSYFYPFILYFNSSVNPSFQHSSFSFLVFLILSFLNLFCLPSILNPLFLFLLKSCLLSFPHSIFPSFLTFFYSPVVSHSLPLYLPSLFSFLCPSFLPYIHSPAIPPSFPPSALPSSIHSFNASVYSMRVSLRKWVPNGPRQREALRDVRPTPNLRRLKASSIIVQRKLNGASKRRTFPSPP